ncbi:glycosyltransferase family 4 protein [Dokdonella sp.]|uniref:glycosyltransferase family 4 protein n=1 Tax=Dokdonella sp. TaxID=2291710 RepID=UPI002F3ED72A
MRLLVVVDTYVPARISGALQMRDLARELVAQGHEPTVIVPSADLRAAYAIERVDGVEVLRVRTAPTKDVGLLRRGLAECMLPFALRRGLAKSPLAQVRWDGVIWYSPTIFLAAAVHAVKRRCSCRAYLILRDLFPDWALDTGVMRKGLAYRFFKRVERYQYSVADVIGVQTAANLPRVAPDVVAGARIEVLDNWLSEPERAATAFDREAGPLAGRTVFAYTGNMGAAQGMDGLLDLATRMQSRRDVGFLFVGRGSDMARLADTVDSRRLDNVLFLGEVDAAEIPSILAQCHVGLIALDPRHTTHNIPGKLLTYLRAGLPVLARINPGNDLEALIDTAGIGRVCVGDAWERRLVQFAEELASDAALREAMGHRARALARDRFSTARAAAQVVRGLRDETVAQRRYGTS